MNAADPNSVVDSGLIKALILSLKEEGVPNPEQYLKDGITHGQFIGAYAMMGRDLRAIHKDLSVDSDLKAGAAAILSKFKQLPDDQRDGLADGLAIMSQLVTHKLLMPEVKAEVKTDAPEKGDLKEAHAESAAPKSPEKRRGGFRNEGKGSVATTGGRNGRNQVSDQMNVAAQNPPKTSEPRIPERIASFDTGPAA